MSNTALDFFWVLFICFSLEGFFLSFPLFSLLVFKKKDTGEEYVMQKSNSKIAIFLGGVCEGKKKKTKTKTPTKLTCKTMLLFLLGLFVLFEMSVLAQLGQDGLCLCVYTDQGNTLRSSTETLPSHGACLHETLDSSAPASLPA